MWALDPQGSGWIFYTMGADRATSFLDWTANPFPLELLWRGADALWRGFQERVCTFVNKNRGAATVGQAHSARYNWNRVRQLLSLENMET
jgi:hypothetical protein